MDLQTYRKCAAKTESLPESITCSHSLVSGILVSLEELTNILDSIKKNMFYKRSLMEEADIKCSLQNISSLLQDLSKGDITTQDVSVIDVQQIRVLHSMIGIITESAGELPSLVNSVIKEGNLDHVNLNEEYGDVMWYIDRGLDSIGTSIEQSLDININKLSARYPEGHFDNERAINRSLDVEREILDTLVCDEKKET